MPKSRAIRLLLCVALAAASPTGTRATPAYDFAPLTAIVQQASTDFNLRGAALRITINDQAVYEQFFGTYTTATYVPIASCTKTFSAAVIMSLVDSGMLSLDDKVSKYILSFSKPGGYADITIRQCFSHTSGLPGSEDNPALSDTSITLAQSADLIAEEALIGPPGGQFAYGGLSMQVAGRCAEVASGQSWDNIFRLRIAIPLGMTSTDYAMTALLPPYRPQTNPRIAGGGRSSLRDYAKFSQMLLNRGLHNGQRILSESAVLEMQRDNVVGLPVVSSPWDGPTHYGLGTWLDLIDAANQPVETSADGAFGFVSWIDRSRHISAVFEVLDRFQDMLPYIRQMQATLRQIVDTTPSSAGDTAATLVNLSARTTAGTGAATLIAGFAIAGGARDMMVRGIGPGLAPFQVPNTLADPVLTLFDGGTAINSNDDWSDNDGRALGAFSLTVGSRDSVLSTTLSTKTYTAQVTPHTGTSSGEALVEIYDAGGASGHLSNLSTRCALAVDGTLIAGFVIAGESGALKRVLLRAVGPALSGFGVAGTLIDPELKVFDGSASLIAVNDNWGGSVALLDAFASTGAFAFASGSSTDAALTLALPPGNYSAHLSSVQAGASGVALVELYELP